VFLLDVTAFSLVSHTQVRTRVWLLFDCRNQLCIVALESLAKILRANRHIFDAFALFDKHFADFCVFRPLELLASRAAVARHFAIAAP
jgi:hypothetical protein